MADDLSKHLSIIFNLFVPNAPFLYPLMMFSGGREKVHWEQMGYHIICQWSIS